jgi:hypothetical protein
MNDKIALRILPVVLLGCLAFAAIFALSGCGSTVRAIHLTVVEQGDGPIENAEVTVVTGNERRWLYGDIPRSDSTGYVVVDSVRKSLPVELSIVASSADTKYKAKPVKVNPGEGIKKMPLVVSLEIMPELPADTTSKGQNKDDRLNNGTIRYK